MPPFLLPAAGTLLGWLVLSTLFVGLGWLALRVLGGQTTGAAFWLGFALVLAYLQLWSLWLPLEPLALLPLVPLAALGWLARGARQLVGCAGRHRRALAVVAGAGVLATIPAQGPLIVYDAGLYHLAAIRWAATFPATPGLGNLMPALGLSSSVFLYLAAISTAPLPGFHLGLGLLMFALLVDLSWAASRSRPDMAPAAAGADRYLALFMILPLLGTAGAVGFSTTQYDVANDVLAIVIVRQLYAMLNAPRTSGGLCAQALVVTALACAMVTVKISTAVFAVSSIVFAAALLRPLPIRPRLLAQMAGLCLLFVAPLLARSTLMTGWPLYPEPVFGVAADWAMPADVVQRYRDILADFARVHGPGFENASQSWSWIGAWLARNAGAVFPPLVFAFGTPAAVWLRYREAARLMGRRWLVLVPVWTALVVWFVTAPDPRYAHLLLWLAGVIPLAFLVAVLRAHGRAVALGAFIVAFQVADGAWLLALAPETFSVLSSRVVPSVLAPPLAIYSTASGLQLYTPVDGDQMWDAPLPATPYPQPALRLRCPDSLACGFSVH